MTVNELIVKLQELPLEDRVRKVALAGCDCYREPAPTDAFTVLELDDDVNRSWYWDGFLLIESVAPA